MPIQWSALSVAAAMDEVEALINEAEPFLAQAKQKAREAKGILNLPDYMHQRLGRLIGEIERVIGGTMPWSGQPYEGTFKASIKSIRDSIPSGAVEAERNRGKQLAL